MLRAEHVPPTVGLQRVALVRAQGLWESDNLVWALQVPLTADTAAAKQFSSLHSAHRALLQLSIYPAGFLPDNTHPDSAFCRSVLPSARSHPLRQLSPCLWIWGGGLLRGWEAPLCPAWFRAPPKRRCQAQVRRKAGTQPGRWAQERWQWVPHPVAQQEGTSPTGLGGSPWKTTVPAPPGIPKAQLLHGDSVRRPREQHAASEQGGHLLSFPTQKSSVLLPPNQLL